MMNGISPHTYITEVQTAIAAYTSSEMPRVAETEMQIAQTREYQRDTLIQGISIDLVA